MSQGHGCLPEDTPTGQILHNLNIKKIRHGINYKLLGKIGITESVPRMDGWTDGQRER